MFRHLISSDRQAIRALSRYWDEVVHRSPAVPVPPVEAKPDQTQTIRQLHVLEEAQRSAAPFADELRREILARRQEYQTMNTHEAILSGPSLRSIQNSEEVFRPRRSLDTIDERVRNWWRSLRALTLLQRAALLTVVAMVSLIINQLSGDDGNPSIIAPGDATPVATPAPSPSSGVPMYRGNTARTGEMPGPGPSSQPSELWAYTPMASVGSPQVVMDGVMYIGRDDGKALALDTRTGEEIWKFDTGAVGPVTVSAGDVLVFVTNEAGELIAVDRNTGVESWRHTGARRRTTPILYDGLVLVDGIGGASFVLDQSTGDEVYNFSFPSELSRSPALADGVAYGGTAAGTVFAVDVATGTELWQVETKSPETSTPAVADGMVFLSLWTANRSGSLIALSATDGQQLWQFNSSSGKGFSATSVAAGLVFAGGFDGTVYALNERDGTLAWSYTTQSELGIGSAPGIAGGTFYVATQNGEIIALDAASGAEKWTVTATGTYSFGPIVDNGMLWVSTLVGEIQAFGVGIPPSATPIALRVTQT